MIETSVLIVGGGPVGMALGLVLDRFGVDHVIVERNASTTDHPKSRGLTARTMETFRVCGIEERVRAGGLGPDADVMWMCETATGPVLATTNPEPANLHTPSQKSMVAQDVVEEALADALARNDHTTMRRTTELFRFEQDDDAVTGWIRDLGSGEETAICAQYMIGCDGAGSRVRRELGIEMEGPDALFTMANYYYRANTSHVPHARQILSFSVRPTDPTIPPGGILSSGVDATRWLYSQMLTSDDQPFMDDEELTRLVRGHWGIPDLSVELISVLKWRVSAQIPKAFQVGRVLLAGDAAHRFPPTGGMGLNSGVQDAQNLGWKLALVLKGLAPQGLLATYESERRQVAVSNNEWSVGNMNRLINLGKAYETRREDPQSWRAAVVDLDNHLHSAGQGMGYIYERGALIDDGTPMPPHDPRYYWPTDRPGARFPHLWIDPQWSESTIDWFDTAFVLVCGPDAEDWRVAGKSVAAGHLLPLEVRTLPMMAGPLSFGYAGAVLVRPDGHVAWRPGGVGADKATALADALGEVASGRQVAS